MKTSTKARIEEFGRISSLFNRAIASPSQREKNAVLTELKNTSVNQIAALEQTLLDNEIKKKTLADEQAKLTEVQNCLEDTKQKLLLLKELKLMGESLNENKSIRDIKNIEKDISALIQLERPNLIQTAYDKGDNVGLRLHDIKLQRLDEQIYALRKRVLEIEKNEEYGPSINNQYGSVFGLMDTYHQLVAENEKLKTEEKSYSHNTQSKRRNLSHMTNYSARELGVFLSKEFKIECEAYETLSGMKYSEGKDISVLLNDPGFDEPPASDISKDQVNEAQKEVSLLEAKIKALEGTISKDPDESLGRVGKMFAVTARILEQEKENREKIEAAESEIISKAKSLRVIAEEHQQAKREFTAIFEPFYRLVKAHSSLKADLKQNIATLQSLSSVSSILALQPPILEEFFKGRGSAERAILSARREKPKLIEVRSSPAAMTAVVVPLPHLLEEKSAPEQDKFMESCDHIVNFYMTSLLMECSSPLFGRFVSRPTKAIETITTDIRREVSNEFGSFNSYLTNSVQTLKQLDQDILRKVVSDVESQTEFGRLVDNDAQTDPPPPGKKGSKRR